jgi:NADP-dependent 3-hydroxy acid dehydrogenase YdfG
LAHFTAQQWYCRALACRHQIGSDCLKALTDRISQAGGDAAYATTDVKRRDDLSNLVKLACERYRKLDVLVNNAGIAPTSLLDDPRVDDWEEMIDVNIKGVLYGIAAALPVFRKQGFGHFVNTASTAGLVNTMEKMAISPDAIARAIAFAIEQPPDVDVGEIIIRPTAQG